MTWMRFVVSALLRSFFVAGVTLLAFFYWLTPTPGPGASAASNAAILDSWLEEDAPGRHRHLAVWVRSEGGGAAGWVRYELLVFPTAVDLGPDDTRAMRGEVAARFAERQAMRCRWRDGVLEIDESGIELEVETDLVKARLDLDGLAVRLVDFE